MSVQRAKELIWLHLEHYNKYIPDLEQKRENLKHELDVVNNKIAIYSEKVNDLKVILVEIDSE